MYQILPRCSINILFSLFMWRGPRDVCGTPPAKIPNRSRGVSGKLFRLSSVDSSAVTSMCVCESGSSSKSKRESNDIDAGYVIRAVREKMHEAAECRSIHCCMYSSCENGHAREIWAIRIFWIRRAVGIVFRAHRTLGRVQCHTLSAAAARWLRTEGLGRVRAKRDEGNVVEGSLK